MIASNVEAHVHFRHSEQEIKALNDAIIPMAEYIARASRGDERQSMHRITGCRYFRYDEAKRTYLMLLRAVKFARAHLDEYFESMRAQTLIDAQSLEDAAKDYWQRFEELATETTPTH